MHFLGYQKVHLLIIACEKYSFDYKKRGADMYCKICGFMNKENSNFCCKCGETLADENVQGKNGLQKQTWIILIVSIIISLVIGVTSTMFLTSGEVKTVVELVLTGEEQAISEAHALMEDLSDKQKKRRLAPSFFNCKFKKYPIKKQMIFTFITFLQHIDM